MAGSPTKMPQTSFEALLTAGFEMVINSIAMAHREDEARLARASAVLDDLYEYFKRKRSDRGRREVS